MTPTPGPRRPAPPAAELVDGLDDGPLVPSSWSAAHPVDDDPAPSPPPPAPAARARPGGGPARAGAPPGPRQSPATRADKRTAAAVGRGAPRTAQTGRPRVDWGAYDAQLYDTEPEWILYRAWTRLPVDGRWWSRAWQHLLAFIIGPMCELLWIGISMRAGIARAAEHLADKRWRRLIHIFEIDPHAGDHGPRGARHFTTEDAATRYENGRIAAECPRFNVAGNDRAFNPGATHLRKRIQLRHRVAWRQQAGRLAAAWSALAGLCAWAMWPDTPTGPGGGFAVVVNGFATAAVLMTGWRITALAVRGAQPTTQRKRKIAQRYTARA